MKTTLVIALVLTTFSALASSNPDSPKKVVSRIQADKKVRCEYQSASFAVCIGSNPETKICRSTYTYFCDGESSFTLKLKVKSYFDSEAGERDSAVQDIRFE